MRFYVTFIKPVIECSACGVLAECGLTSVGSWVNTTDELHAFSARTMPDIPVGWSSNGFSKGRRDFRCKECTG